MQSYEVKFKNYTVLKCNYINMKILKNPRILFRVLK
jgi:hypothetical protein